MRGLILIILLFISAKFTIAQMLCPDIMEFGVSASGEYSGSGHGTNITFNMVALNDYKSIELGAILNEDATKFKGANFKYKTFFGKYNYYYGNALIKPYILYNCLYQMEYVNQPIIIKTSTETLIIEKEEGGMVSSMEHYIGTGIMFRFLSNFYFDANMAVGAYFGSLDKTKAPNKIGFHDVNHGYTANLKIGVGYILR